MDEDVQVTVHIATPTTTMTTTTTTRTRTTTTRTRTRTTRTTRTRTKATNAREVERARVASTTTRRAASIASSIAFVAGVDARARKANAGVGVMRTIAIEGAANERWVKIDAKVDVPERWVARPGRRPKVSAVVMYTDTYGPNNRWTWVSPALASEDGEEVKAIALSASSAPGLERVSDLGAIGAIDPARAFGFEFDGLVASDVTASKSRVDRGGQTYYQWELDDGASAFLLASCVSGGALYAFCMQVAKDKFTNDPAKYRAVLDSFTVEKVDESRADMSSRIYENR